MVAGLCEIGGGYLVWGWMREDKPLLWALVGAAILAAYGVVAALQPNLGVRASLRCLRRHLHCALADVWDHDRRVRAG